MNTNMTEDDLAIWVIVIYRMERNRTYGMQTATLLHDRADYVITHAAMGAAKAYVEGWTSALIAQDNRA